MRVFLIIGGYKKITIKLSKQDQKQRPKTLTSLEIKIAQTTTDSGLFLSL